MEAITLAPDAEDALLRGMSEFWPGITLRPPQRDAIASVCAMIDTLVCLSTGYGKSMCFQAPAAMAGVPGVTVVLTPLLALCEDQVRDLVDRGVSVARLTSDVDPDVRLRLEADLLDEDEPPETRLLYVTPEGLQKERTRDICTSLHARGLLRAIAVDEAHMVRRCRRELPRTRDWPPDTECLTRRLHR